MLAAGWAQREITYPGEMHLIGVYSKKPRLGQHIRDPLYARAVALDHGDSRVVLVVADLLCISEELFSAVARRLAVVVPGFEASQLLLSASHSHSSYGGFFRSSAVAPMLGTHRPEVFSFLEQILADLVVEALADLASATVCAAKVEVPGLTASRRQAGGPHDDSMILLRLERAARRPLDLINLSGHPVVVAERESNSVSADYPGLLCRIVEEQGSRPLVFHAALGGVSILFPEFQMSADRHLKLLSGIMGRGYQGAVADLKPLEKEASLELTSLHLEHGLHRSRVFSNYGSLGRLTDWALAPALARLARAGREALPFGQGVPLSIVRLGQYCLVASACELGVTMVQAIRKRARAAGCTTCQIMSLTNGYSGYLHTSKTYRRWPESGYRHMALYENALAMFGYQFGDQILQALDESFG